MLQKIFLVLLCLVSVIQCERKFYIASNITEHENCSATDNCYSLLEAINNQSFFFTSDTTLELISDRYEINETVDQILIANVSSLLINGMMGANGTHSATIYCQPGATIGFLLLNCSNVVISNINFLYCSSKLNPIFFKDIYSLFKIHS